MWFVEIITFWKEQRSFVMIRTVLIVDDQYLPDIARASIKVYRPDVVIVIAEHKDYPLEIIVAPSKHFNVTNTDVVGSSKLVDLIQEDYPDARVILMCGRKKQRKPRAHKPSKDKQAKRADLLEAIKKLIER